MIIYLGGVGGEIVGGELAALGVVKLEGVVVLELGAVGFFSSIVDVLGLGADPLGTVKLRANGAMLVVSNP
jgi:hypothetical protein